MAKDNEQREARPESEARKLALKQAAEGKDCFRANAKTDPLQGKLVELETEIGERMKNLKPKQEKLRKDFENVELRQEVQQENIEIAQLQVQVATVANAISIQMGGKQYTLPIPKPGES
jgi:hypothetical protein